MTSNQLEDKHQVKFVYFDIGNVLLDHTSVVKSVANEYNLDVSELAQVFSSHISMLCKAEISQEDFSRIIRNEFNISDENFDWVSFNNHAIKTILPAHTLLEEISRYVPIGLLSDSWDGMSEYMFERGYIPKLNYSVEAYSHLVGSVKPEEKLMKYAEEKAEVEPECIFFVDDKRTNIEGATDRGWQALIFDPFRVEDSIQNIRNYLANRGLPIRTKS